MVVEVWSLKQCYTRNSNRIRRCDYYQLIDRTRQQPMRREIQRLDICCIWFISQEEFFQLRSIISILIFARMFYQIQAQKFEQYSEQAHRLQRLICSDQLPNRSDMWFGYVWVSGPLIIQRLIKNVTGIVTSIIRGDANNLLMLKLSTRIYKATNPTKYCTR